MLNQFAQYYRGGYPMEHMYANDNQWFALAGFVVFITICGVALFMVYKIATKNSAAIQDKAPIDIAKERYAKGEISKEELTEMKKELSDK